MEKRLIGSTKIYRTYGIAKCDTFKTGEVNKQYPEIEVKEFNNSHDRFLIIDSKAVYHFGASLKDLGKKRFAFSKMDVGVDEMLRKLEGIG